MTDIKQISETDGRICAHCGEPFDGRSDKRYCSDGCRNAAKREKQKRENWQEPAFVEKVNRVLRQNRMILKELLGPAEMRIISKMDLLEQGFHFGYHTSILTVPDKKPYYFCYEYGWLHADNEKILVVRNEKRVNL